jgi:hypothetical protein
MAINFPGPYALRLFYTVDSLVHKAEYNIALTTVPDVGDPFTALEAVMRNGGGRALDALVDDWVATFDALFSAADTTIDYVELWQYIPDSFETIYISTYTVGLPGVSASAFTGASQRVFTFRTTEGGIMRVMFLETPFGSVPGITPYASLTGTNLAVMDFIADDTNCFLGRDTSYPIVPLRLLTGQNEKTFRQRYR